MLSWVSYCFQQNGLIVCSQISVFLIMENINTLNGVIQNIK